MTGITFYVPEATAISPTDGECITNSWWTVHPEHGLAFYATRKRPYDLEPGEVDSPSPQCNRDQYTAAYIQKQLYPDCETRKIPVVFLGHAIREMHRHRKALTSAPSSALRYTEGT